MKDIGLCGTLILGLFLTSCLMRANIVNNPGFETTDFTGWTASAGTEVDCNGGLQFDGNCAAQGAFADLSQVLATTPGDVYVLNFWTVDTQSGLYVSWDGTNIYTPHTAYSSYTNLEFDGLLATTSSTVLDFGFSTPAGSFIDDVDVELAPEPSAGVYSFSGLVLLGALLRRGRVRMRA